MVNFLLLDHLETPNFKYAKFKAKWVLIRNKKVRVFMFVNKQAPTTKSSRGLLREIEVTLEFATNVEKFGVYCQNKANRVTK